LVARNSLAATAGLFVIAASALWGAQVGAATSTAAFAVSVTVQSSCQITASALGFGTYAGALDIASSILTLTCTDTTTYNVGLLANGTARLAYALYSNAGRTVNWGDTVGADTVAGTGNGSAQVLTVYGRIAAGQLVKPGTYSDTIIATVTY
jgi:spore coat protein U-like protein